MGLFNHSYKNPAKEAMPYLQQAGDTLQDTYSPYIQRGENAYQMLEPQYNQMTNNPSDYYDDIFSKYTPSSSYQAMSKSLSAALDNTMRASGTYGTDEHDRKKADLIHSLLSQDMQQYFNNVTGIQSQGRKGYENFDNRGYNAASTLGSDMSNLYGSEATLAFNGAQDYNQGHNSKINQMAQLLSMALSGYQGYQNNKSLAALAPLLMTA